VEKNHPTFSYHRVECCRVWSYPQGGAGLKIERLALAGQVRLIAIQLRTEQEVAHLEVAEKGGKPLGKPERVGA
jgi:hypothetical protein